MYEALLAATAAVAMGGAIIAWDGTRDPFHPLVFICPMFLFLYGWMPWKLNATGNLINFFDTSQLLQVQTLYCLGVLAFIVGCLSAGTFRFVPSGPAELSSRLVERLAIGGFLVGSIGLACWLLAVLNVGGINAAFGKSYGGGWDDNGYIRDGSLLLLGGMLLLLFAIVHQPRRAMYWIALVTFVIPWLTQTIFTARRGPAFAIVTILSMGWYLARRTRPNLLVVLTAGLGVGYLALFLVTNRSELYMGSDFNFKTDVEAIVEKPDTGNEYIYGSGSVLSGERRNHYFWGRRYLAQILVRPIPAVVWPTKYEDFGVPELRHNAGTGEGFSDVLGWDGAVGSAPGIVADVWLEFWWLAVPFMAVLGRLYGTVWNKAVREGGVWMTQYGLLAALSIYLVMQTMEAIIFRTVLISVPMWLVWRWVERAERAERGSVYFTADAGWPNGEGLSVERS